jgi:hypothetical protein
LGGRIAIAVIGRRLLRVGRRLLRRVGIVGRLAVVRCLSVLPVLIVVIFRGIGAGASAEPGTATGASSWASIAGRGAAASRGVKRPRPGVTQTAITALIAQLVVTDFIVFSLQTPLRILPDAPGIRLTGGGLVRTPR